MMWLVAYWGNNSHFENGVFKYNDSQIDSKENFREELHITQPALVSIV